MSKPIEDYGMIGDGETVALLGRDGSIDWLCWPRFDSPACFAALLGDERHGFWTLESIVKPLRRSRRYRGDTLILENKLETPEGAVGITDFMPARLGSSRIVRIVRGLSGRVKMRMALKLRFEYGAISPWLKYNGDSVCAELGPHLVVLRSTVKLVIESGTVLSSFVLSEGDQVYFVLSYGVSTDQRSVEIEAGNALAATEDYWRTWIVSLDKVMTFPEVRRSLLTLKALINCPTGGIVAAPTTSLPEQSADKLNWDYRYAWIRDSTFTLCALLNSGCRKEAESWLAWLLRTIGPNPADIHIMYRVDGTRRLSEHELSHLPGYDGAQPVRVGNAASSQRQIDVFGEILDAFGLARRAGIAPSSMQYLIERALVEHIAKIWQEPDQGMWESRGEPRHYTYSKVMCWVGVDRFLRHNGSTLDKASRGSYENLRRAIHEEVCREGYDFGTGSFVHYLGGHSVDASLLLLPLVGFLPIDDERIAGTIARVENELMQDGLVLRHPKDENPHQGAFITCGFWLVDCWRMQGRNREARALFARLAALANDLGLLSEEYSVSGRRLAGNFPQALSHLSLINAVLGFAGTVLQRAGG